MTRCPTQRQTEQINQLYIYFLARHPDCDEGIYLSGTTNQILAFAAYVAEMSYQNAHKILENISITQWERLQQIIDREVDAYLLKHAKVLALA